MLSFKEKRAIQKEIKAQYEKLDAEKGFKAKRETQKAIKGLYAKLQVKDVDQSAINQALMDLDKIKGMNFISTAAFESAYGKVSKIFDTLDANESRDNRVQTKHAEILDFLEAKAKEFVKSEVERGLKSRDELEANAIIEDITTNLSDYGWLDEELKPLEEMVINIETGGGDETIDQSIIERLSTVRDVLQSEDFTLFDLKKLDRSIRKIEEVESSLQNNDLYQEVVSLYEQAINSREAEVTTDSVNAGSLFEQDGDVTGVVAMDGVKNKVREFNTYPAWKRAVKKLDPKAEFTGDKDIDGAFKKGKFDAEWDGDVGQIVALDSITLDALIPIEELEKVEDVKPTKKQIESGNYKKPKVKVAGMTISIENQKGSTRKGTDSDGKDWKVTMKDHYGYILGTVGADGEHIDVFLNSDASRDDLQKRDVFVISQNDMKTGEFDEHKVIIGAKNMREAKEVYHRNYSKDFTGYGSAKRMSIEDFKKWAADLTDKQKAK